MQDLSFFTELIGVWRRCNANERRTKRDWAEQIQILLEEDYPDVERVILVLDNWNTHTTSALYERFPAPQAFRLAQRLEIHYSPKHGSWLNIAEIELSELTSQCLNRRIASLSFVSLKFLRNYLIPLPPLAEQKRIVAKLEKVLPSCEKLNK